MPNEERKPEIAGAICAPPPIETNGDKIAQPRQPTSLHGLLKFAMEATKSEDAHESHFQPMDEERRKFLEQAVHSLTIDVVEVIMKQIKVLEKVETLQDNENNTEYIKAFERILDFVCDIDSANDFHKIGGFSVLPSCLQCKDPQIRAETCNLLAELCQNNPYCQRVFLENGFMPILVSLVENDSDKDVIVKAIYAISCNVRQNSTGSAQLIQYKGLQVFLETLKKSEVKSTIKICFLLNSLCSSQSDFKNRLIFTGYIPVLLSILSGEPKEDHEHVLGLLYRIIEDNQTAVSECRQKNNTKQVIEEYLQKIKGKEEYNTEADYCNNILQTLFLQN